MNEESNDKSLNDEILSSNEPISLEKSGDKNKKCSSFKLIPDEFSLPIVNQK